MKILTIDIRTIDKDLGVNSPESVTVTGTDEVLNIVRQKTGFGYKRFFICNRCNERRERLYLFTNTLNVYCRSCSPINIYRGIQNTTKGGTEYIEYRMKRLAKDYKINFKYPFNYMLQSLSRPKYMRHEKWREGLRKLQILENMRFQTIIYKTKYKPEFINYVLDHQALIRYDLYHLQKYIIDWHKVVRELKA